MKKIRTWQTLSIVLNDIRRSCTRVIITEVGWPCPRQAATPWKPRRGEASGSSWSSSHPRSSPGEGSRRCPRGGSWARRRARRRPRRRSKRRGGLRSPRGRRVRSSRQPGGEIKEVVKIFKNNIDRHPRSENGADTGDRLHGAQCSRPNVSWVDFRGVDPHLWRSNKKNSER